MFKKLFVLSILTSTTAFSSQYMAPSEGVQRRLDDLHEEASLNDASENDLERIGKLYACFLIEDKLWLPQGDDSVYINEGERRLQMTDPNDERMGQVDKVIKLTLEQIEHSNSEFSKAAADCLRDLGLVGSDDMQE